MSEQQPITWAAIRDAVAALHEGLMGARDQANEAVWNPPSDRRLDRIYVDAYADLRFDVDGLAHRAEALVERMAESAPPARPLGAVLADIEAEGHEYAIDSNYGNGGKACFSSKRREPRWDNDGEWDEEKWARYRAWEREVEAGAVWMPAGAVDQAAEARLADIRKLRAEKALAELASGVLGTLGVAPESAVEDEMTARTLYEDGPDPDGMDHPGPEEADIEHGADVVAREQARREAEASEGGA